MGNSIFEQSDDEQRVACMITSVSPLTITIGTTTGILAVPQKNVTYNTGPAIALVRRVGLPRIYLIGP